LEDENVGKKAFVKGLFVMKNGRATANHVSLQFLFETISNTNICMPGRFLDFISSSLGLVLVC